MPPGPARKEELVVQKETLAMYSYPSQKQHNRERINISAAGDVVSVGRADGVKTGGE